MVIWSGFMMCVGHIIFSIMLYIIPSLSLSPYLSLCTILEDFRRKQNRDCCLKNIFLLLKKWHIFLLVPCNMGKFAIFSTTKSSFSPWNIELLTTANKREILVLFEFLFAFYTSNSIQSWNHASWYNNYFSPFPRARMREQPATPCCLGHFPTGLCTLGGYALWTQRRRLRLSHVSNGGEHLIRYIDLIFFWWGDQK